MGSKSCHSISMCQELTHLYPIVQVFEAWVAPRLTQSMPLSCLSGSIIGVDATYYLEVLLAAHKEPLLSALGGLPLALENTIKKELDDIQSSGLRLHFVFNGLGFGTKDDPFRYSVQAAEANARAFEIYESDNAQAAIEIFRASGEVSRCS